MQTNSRGGIGLAVVSQNSHSESHADAIVSAQGGFLCDDLVILDHKVDGISFEVVLTASVLLADHIHMSLQNDTGMVLKTLAGGLAHDDVVNIVSLVLQIVSLCKLHQISAHGSFVAGLSGDAGQVLKIAEDLYRLGIGQDSVLHD